MRKNIKIDVMMPVKIGFAVMLLMGLVTLAIILKETQFIFSLGSVLKSAIVISAYDLSLMGAVTIIFISAISLWSLSSGKLLALRNKLAFVTLPNYGYAMVLFAIKMILVYSLYQALLLIAYSVSQVAELSSSFMPLPNYLHESSSLQHFKLLTFVVISLLILTKPKDKMNPGFLIGLAVVPMVISLCLPQFFNFMLSMIGSNMTELPNLSEYETLVFGTSSGFIGIFMTLALVYFLLLMPACYAYASVNKQNFSSFIKWIILGYASSILATAIAASYICNSDSASYIKNNHNIETVALNGKTYRYDLSLVKVPENDYETEFLIESYMGQSMHNSTEVFDYLTSDNYKGDKEKAIEFLSTLHLRNYRLFKKYKENFLKAAKQPMTTTDYMRGAIPLII
ncbi:hypothetical protein [Vibrio harveyi]|uniref:hypothetical protein n=1 Tax=Vibrio harveyi TaxID=669 RepID=UPI003CF0C43A